MVAGWAVVAHAFNPSTREADAGQISVSSRPPWSTRASSRTDSKKLQRNHVSAFNIVVVMGIIALTATAATAGLGRHKETQTAETDICILQNYELNKVK